MGKTLKQLTDADLATARALSDRIQPMFAGLNPGTVGATLAELLATLIAGHYVEGDPKQTAAIRAAILAFHIGVVNELIPVISDEILPKTN